MKASQRAFVVLLAFVVCSITFASGKYVPYTRVLSPNTPYNDTILPCSSQYYNIPNIAGSTSTYLIAQYIENSNTQQTVNIALYYNNFATDENLLVDNVTCTSNCALNLFCGFQPGSYWFAVESPGASGTLTMNISVAIYVRTVTLNSQIVPFSVKVINSSQATNVDEPKTVDHYQIGVGSFSFESDLVVTVSNISVSNGDQLTMCLNFGILANSPTGQCCMAANSSTNGNDFQIKVPSCYLKAGNFYASVQIPLGATANYTISAQFDAPQITAITLPYQGSGQFPAADLNQVNYYSLSYSGGVTAPVLVVSLVGVINGQAQVYIHNSTALAGPTGNCGIPDYATCTTDDVCTITVPTCILGQTTTWYIAVVPYAFNSELPVSYGLTAAVQSSTPTSVVLDSTGKFSYASSIAQAQYQHYQLNLAANQLQADSVLNVLLYINFDVSPVSLFMNYGSLAGTGNCLASDMVCTTTGTNPSQPTTCHFTIQKCNLEAGSYFFSVYGVPNDNYGNTVSYTIKFTLGNSFQLANGTSYSQTVWDSAYSHFHIDLPQSQYQSGQNLHIRISDVANGQITAFLNWNELAGDCPCYTSIQNCTGTANNYCDIYVEYCAFTYGSWFIGVFGEGASNPTSPIGFTITGFIYPPPSVTQVAVNSSTNGLVAASSIDYYTFPVSSYTPTTELVVSLVIVHHGTDPSNPTLNMYLNNGNLADATCSIASCVATQNTVGNAYCIIELDPCEFSNGPWSITVVGDPDGPTHYTLNVATRDTTPKTLSNGVYVVDSIVEDTYNQYVFTTDSLKTTETLLVQLYISQNPNPVVFFSNPGSPAGSPPCYSSNSIATVTNTSAYYLYPSCQLAPNTPYYFGVTTTTHLYYQMPVDYTIEATIITPTQIQATGFPIVGHVKAGFLDQYYLTMQNNPLGQVLRIKVDNVQGGSVTTYVNWNSPAGTCPCYQYTQSFSNTFEYTDYLCNFHSGTYYIGVEGDTATSSFQPISYSMRVMYIQEPVTQITLGTVNVGNVYDDSSINFALSTQGAAANSYLTVAITNVTIPSPASGNLTIYINSGQIGSPQCSLGYCETSTDNSDGCSIVLNACDFNPSLQWYISARADVVGHNSSVPITFNVNATVRKPEQVAIGSVTNDNLASAGAYNHYELTSPVNIQPNQVFQVSVANANNPVNLYLSKNGVAGVGSCRTYIQTCTTSALGNCMITIPPCEVDSSATYFFSVTGSDSSTTYSVSVNITSLGTSTDLASGNTISGTLDSNAFVVYSYPVPSNAPADSYLLFTVTTGSNSLDIFGNYASFPSQGACNSYTCSGNNAVCNYYIPPCCLQRGNRYYVTIYSGPQNPAGSTFGITATYYPGNATVTVPFGTTYNVTYSNLAINQPQFLQTTLQISTGSSVLFQATTSGSMDIYIQKGTKAGSGGCYSYWLHCTASSSTPCVLQLPPCYVNNGDMWYIALNNTGSSANPSYTVQTTEMKIQTLPISTNFNDSVAGNLYKHYQFNWAGSAGMSTFTGSQLIFNITVNNAQNTQFYLNTFGSYAGGAIPNIPTSCLAAFNSCEANSGNNYQCMMPLPLCMITAKETFYLSVFAESGSSTDYSIMAYTQQPTAVTLTPNVATTMTGSSNFVLNTGTVTADQYLVLNVTGITQSSASIGITIWPSCECQSNAAVACTASTSTPCYVSMDPCLFNGGVFYIYADANGAYNYTLLPTIRGSVSPVQALTVGTPYVDQLYAWQYQFYSVAIPNNLVGNQSVTFSVDVNCGNVDFYLNQGSPATAACSNIYSCIGTSSCEFTLDYCDFTGGNYYLTTFVRDNTYMTFNSQGYWQPIIYTVTANIEEQAVTQVAISQPHLLQENEQILVTVDSLNIGTAFHFEAFSQSSNVALSVREGSVISSTCGPTWNTSCSIGQRCRITLDPCSFQNGNFYITATGTNVTVVSYYEPQTIPILTPNTPVTGSVVPKEFQFYKVSVDNTQPNFLMTVQVTVTDITAGTVQLLLNEDNLGMVPGDTCYSQQCTTGATGVCTLTFGGCSLTQGTTFFLGVVGASDSSCAVPYSLVVTTSAPVITLSPNSPVCGQVYSGNWVYYYLNAGTTSLPASNVNVTIYQATGPVSIYMQTNYLPTGSCYVETCTSAGSGCVIPVCAGNQIYIGIYGSGTQQEIIDFELVANVMTPTPTSIGIGSTLSGSGPTYYAYTATTGTAWQATLTAPSRVGTLIATAGNLATSQCVDFSCSVSGSTSCVITNFCDVVAGTWYFYVNSPLSFTLQLTNPAVPVNALTTTPATGTIGGTTSWNFWKASATPSGSTALDIVITNVYGGNLTVFVNPGIVGASTCYNANFTVTQAQGSYTYTIMPCELFEYQTYFVSVTASTYGCSVTYNIAQATTVGVTPTAIDATKGYSGTINMQNTAVQYFSLSNVAPTADQYVHATVQNVVGGEVNVLLYAGTLDADCIVGNCTTTTGSCYINVPCAVNTPYFVQVTGSNSCSTITYTLTVKASSFTALTSSPTSFTYGGVDQMYATVSSTNSFVVQGALSAGSAVQMTLFQDPCLTQQWESVTCAYGSECRISVPTKAEHSGMANWYLVATGVLGNTFSMSASTGTANCATPNLPTTAFCDAVVTYSSWTFLNTTAIDIQAYNRYEWLLEHFSCGLTDMCLEALQRYACYESFPACDTNGFYVGLCSYACTDVETACGDWCTYGLPGLACSSGRYIAPSGTCTGIGPIYVTTTTGFTTAVSSTTTSVSSSTTVSGTSGPVSTSTGSTGSTSETGSTTSPKPSSAVQITVPVLMIAMMVIACIAALL